MYEFAGSKSAKLVVQKIREIGSPFLFSLLLAFDVCRVTINLHTELTVCCLLQYLLVRHI
jgi:hypothetical protein